jgi:hypothetical protein
MALAAITDRASANSNNSTVINGGTISVGGSLSNGSGLTIENGGTISLGGGISNGGNVTLGSGTLQIGSGTLILGVSNTLIGTGTGTLKPGVGATLPTNSTNGLPIGLTNTTLPTNPISFAPIVTAVCCTKDIVPGGMGTNSRFASFGNPAFNDYNHVAFRATVSDVTAYPIVYAMPKQASILPSASVTNLPVPLPTNPPIPVLPLYTNTWSGIWAQDQSGTLQLVVRSAPMIWDIGGFSSFSDPVYNNSNNIAFIGNYSPGFIYIPFPVGTNGVAVNTFRGGNGVWTSSTLTNPLNPVAFVGESAPGCSPSTTFRSFDQIALPDQGGVVILATVNSGASGQQGIWAQDTAGKLQLIARQGGTVKVGGVNKTIAMLSFLNSPSSSGGQTRHFSQDTGNLIFSVTFSDRTQAIMKVIFP